eukprot:Em0020g570a
MSAGCDTLSMKEDDVKKLLAASAHLGDSNVDFQMKQYVYKVKQDGAPILNLKKMWEKLLLAARVIAAIENPADIIVLSNKPFGQRAILKFAYYTGANAIAGRFTPGTFTNQIQAAFREPRLLIVSDPRADHQPITEASYVNIPIIGFCNTNSPLKYIDVAIPCNNLGKHAIGLMWWFLAREVLRLRGTISRDIPWDVMPDLFFYREPEEVEKDEQLKIEAEGQTGDQWTSVGATGEPLADSTVAGGEQWGEAPGGDWGAEPVPGSVPTAIPVTIGGGPAPDEWNVAPTTATRDWGADDSEWSAADGKGAAGNW